MPHAKCENIRPARRLTIEGDDPALIEVGLMTRNFSRTEQQADAYRYELAQLGPTTSDDGVIGSRTARGARQATQA